MPTSNTVIRAKNAAVLAKIEVTEGVDAAPVPGLDAVLVENPKVKYEFETETTSEAGGSLDSSAPIPGGTKVTVTFDVFLKGGGVAGTPPEYGKLLRACAMAETIVAAPIPAAPAAVTAGTTASVTLAGTASAVAQAYRGLPITISGGVANAAGTYPVADYTAGKVATLAAAPAEAPDATSLWQVPACVSYVPVSGDVPSLTLYVYRDKKRVRVVGARGTVTVKMTSGKAGRLSFSFTGIFVDETDNAVPAGLVYDATRPPSWRDGRALLDRKVAAMASLSVAVNNKLTMPGNPNQAEGYDPPVITSRSITGSCDPLATLVATRSAIALMRAGTQQALVAELGETPGNRAFILCPAAQQTAHDTADREGLEADSLSFSGTGLDCGLYITLF